MELAPTARGFGGGAALCRQLGTAGAAIPAPPALPDELRRLAGERALRWRDVTVTRLEAPTSTGIEAQKTLKTASAAVKLAMCQRVPLPIPSPGEWYRNGRLGTSRLRIVNRRPGGRLVSEARLVHVPEDVNHDVRRPVAVVDRDLAVGRQLHDHQVGNGLPAGPVQV